MQLTSEDHLAIAGSLSFFYEGAKRAESGVRNGTRPSPFLRADLLPEGLRPDRKLKTPEHDVAWLAGLERLRLLTEHFENLAKEHTPMT